MAAARLRSGEASGIGAAGKMLETLPVMPEPAGEAGKYATVVALSLYLLHGQHQVGQC
jgi:hypothetical protein